LADQQVGSLLKPDGPHVVGLSSDKIGQINAAGRKRDRRSGWGPIAIRISSREGVHRLDLQAMATLGNSGQLKAP
jgi:hypothetical protein